MKSSSSIGEGRWHNNPDVTDQIRKPYSFMSIQQEADETDNSYQSMSFFKYAYIKYKKTGIFLLASMLLLIIGLFITQFKNSYYPQIKFQFKGPLEQSLTNNIKQLLQKNRYYDIHYFVDDQHSNMGQHVILKKDQRYDQPSSQNSRPLLKITQSIEQLEVIVWQMQNPSYRKQKVMYLQDYKTVSSQNIDKLFFARSLKIFKNKKQFLQAEFYRLDKQYGIGSYGSQLKLCVVLNGRNDAGSVLKMYKSIKDQNYTNYDIVHIDDNSNDGTLEKIVEYLDRYQQFKKKVTLLTQPIRKNALFNRDLAIRKYCQQQDIILDLDADDYLIGRQVFQLVNTLYQKGKTYKGNIQDIWVMYLSNFQQKLFGGIPITQFHGQLPEEQLQSSSYRSIVNWRTTELRTYRRKLYMKIDTNDFIDKDGKPNSYYFEQSDAFVAFAMVELSAPKHLQILDQFVYFYNVDYFHKKDSIQILHSSISSQILPHYNPLSSLDETPTRNAKIKAPDNFYEIYEQRKKIIIKKREQMRKEILKQLQNAELTKN